MMEISFKKYYGENYPREEIALDESITLYNYRETYKKYERIFKELLEMDSSDKNFKNILSLSLKMHFIFYIFKFYTKKAIAFIKKNEEILSRKEIFNLIPSEDYYIFVFKFKEASPLLIEIYKRRPDLLPFLQEEYFFNGTVKIKNSFSIKLKKSKAEKFIQLKRIDYSKKFINFILEKKVPICCLSTIFFQNNKNIISTYEDEIFNSFDNNKIFSEFIYLPFSYVLSYVLNDNGKTIFNVIQHFLEKINSKTKIRINHLLELTACEVDSLSELDLSKLISKFHSKIDFSKCSFRIKNKELLFNIIRFAPAPDIQNSCYMLIDNVSYEDFENNLDINWSNVNFIDTFKSASVDERIIKLFNLKEKDLLKIYDNLEYSMSKDVFFSLTNMLLDELENDRIRMFSRRSVRLNLSFSELEILKYWNILAERDKEFIYDEFFDKLENDELKLLVLIEKNNNHYPSASKDNVPVRDSFKKLKERLKK